MTPRFPNFRFVLADMRNTHYNPKGRLFTAEYIFPYDDEQFDFVFLTSVSTHLLPDAQINYLSEIRRVLKDDGRALMTFLLLNRQAEDAMATGRCAFGLNDLGSYGMTSYRFESKENPEETIAYPEDVILSRMEEAGLELVYAVQYGNWSGRSGGLSFQDLVVARKAMTKRLQVDRNKLA